MATEDVSVRTALPLKGVKRTVSLGSFCLQKFRNGNNVNNIRIGGMNDEARCFGL